MLIEPYSARHACLITSRGRNAQLLRKMESELKGGDDHEGIEANEAAKKELQVGGKLTDKQCRLIGHDGNK